MPFKAKKLPPNGRRDYRRPTHGYIEGQNLTVEYRFAQDREERYSDFAAELVALPVDLIVTWGTLLRYGTNSSCEQSPFDSPNGRLPLAAGKSGLMPLAAPRFTLIVVSLAPD